MLNNTGIKGPYTYDKPVQILMNVEHQLSVGCIVPQALGVNVTSNGRTFKIAKAGTPISIDFSNLNAVGKVPAEASGGNPAVVANAVLLHNVDVTNGNNNGTALIFGFVNINRLEADVQAKVTAGNCTVGQVSFLNA